MSARRLVIVGGGPAGLMAADIARAGGLEVDLYESKGSVGRKFLVAGKGGLNLTHAEPLESFCRRFQPEHPAAEWLKAFDADALRSWAKSLGVDTFVGSSGRVFPLDQKAAPLLRGWVRQLRERGVRFHVQHRCIGWGDDGELMFDTVSGPVSDRGDAQLFALGGGSWPVLGSDGAWQDWMSEVDIGISPLRPSNCGFEADWSPHFIERHAGAPIKPVRLGVADGSDWRWQQGELVVSEYGLEGGLIYALSSALREQIARQGHADVRLDLMPNQPVERIADRLRKPRGKRSLSEHLRRTLGLSGVRLALLRECLGDQVPQDAEQLSHVLRALPLRLNATRPLAEAISSAGGIRFDQLDSNLMLRNRPGVFCAGEMLDWEAPTGGYLLSGCFASGRVAANGALRWLESRNVR